MGSSRGPLERHVARVYARIYEVVLGVPRGRVVTYGQVAALAGVPRGARVVGYAMRASLSGRPLPWQRVLGRRGPGLAHVTIKDPVGGALQRRLLEDEGVRFSRSGAVDLAVYGWAPPPRRTRPAAPRKTKGRPRRPSRPSKKRRAR